MSVTFSTIGPGVPAGADQARPATPSAAGGKSVAVDGKGSPSTGSSQATPDKATLDRALDSLRSNAQVIHRNLEFSVDQESGITVVKVVDSTSGNVIRQIPSEVAVKLAESIKEAGNLLFREQA